MFDDLTYDEIEEIIHETAMVDGNWYDLYLALSLEQLRRLRIRIKIMDVMRKRIQMVIT